MKHLILLSSCLHNKTMTIRHLFKTSFTGLRTNRSRSILTILGIVIGITAIMLVVSLGAGAQNLILGEVQGLGTNTIAIIPGQVSTSPSSRRLCALQRLAEAKGCDRSHEQSKCARPHIHHACGHRL